MFGPIQYTKPLRCPHAEMHHCPRYVAAHEAGNPESCMWADDAGNPCAVAHGLMDYDTGKRLGAARLN